MMMKTTKLVRSAVSLAAVLAVSACSMAPVYQRPEMAVPAQFAADAVAAPAMASSTAFGGVSGAASSGAVDAAASASGATASVAKASMAPATDAQQASSVAELPWASYFPDARLQSLIKQALANNRDLRVAMLNIEQLRAAYQIQNADRFPSLNGSISGTRQPSAVSPYPITTSASGGVTVSAFELDLFGRVKSLSEAAAAQVLASEEARKAAHISLIASVANVYYALWADRWQLALSEQTLQTRQDSFKLLQLKFDNGVLNELDLSSGRSLVEAARIARAQAQRQWSQDLSALQLLVGGTVPADALPPVPDVNMAAASSGATASTNVGTGTGVRKDAQTAAQAVQATLWPGLSELPVGLSSNVLLQRPDIAQAEQQLISANANIGAARAARFPRISLTASAGVVSDSLSGLFDGGRSAWSFSPSLTLPIFDMGRAQAGVEVATVKRDIAIAQYDKAIQAAFKEVADALSARRTYAEQADAQLAQAQAEAARMRLSTLRYETGVASQLDLLDAQRGLFAAQQALIAAQLARQQAHISVYKALGGGWHEGTSQTASASLPPPQQP